MSRTPAWQLIICRPCLHNEYQLREKGLMQWGKECLACKAGVLMGKTDIKASSSEKAFAESVAEAQDKKEVAH